MSTLEENEMEQFEARIERIEYAEPGVYLLTIVISPLPVDAPGRGGPVYYSMELDPGNRSINRLEISKKPLMCITDLSTTITSTLR
jgi:hypothetical protein